MSWLTSILAKVGLNFLWEKASGLFSKFFKWVSLYYKEYKRKKANEAQADKIEKIRLEIIALMKAGKPVPPELTEKLREENRRLINGIFD